MNNYPTLSRLLGGYQPRSENESLALAQLKKFWNEHGHTALGNEIAGGSGHIVAHARIENPEGNRVLLVFSGKEQRWRYPGGHIESEPFATALAEAKRAVGGSLKDASPEIYSVNEREIGEYWNTPKHLHFEINFRFVALEITVLPQGAKWFTAKEAESITQK